MTESLFRALTELQSFDDLEDLPDFACETIVSLGAWETAFVSFHLGAEAAHGATGCTAPSREPARSDGTIGGAGSSAEAIRAVAEGVGIS